jgi:SAM-dependent methyltransferase
MIPPDSDANSAAFWDSLYQSDQFHWDLGGPTPVFRRLAQSGQFSPGRMLVLGAGHGHDARLFARHGFAVTAVDFAEEAVAAMQRLARPSSPVKIVQADFFALPATWHNRFEYVLDYTSFCAVLPGRRPEYAALVSRLLKSGGRLIMLAFPIGNRPGGPPYVVQPEAIIDLYAERGFTLQRREAPVDSAPDRHGYEELLILKKV